MKHLLRKAAASKSMVLAQFKMGNDTFSIITRDSMLKGILNGHEILRCDSGEENHKKYERAAGDFVGICAKRNKIASVHIYKSKDKTADYGMKVLQPIVGKDHVIIKDLPKKIDGLQVSDFNVESSLNYQALSSNLKVLEKKIDAICKILNETRNNVLMLTRGKFVKTMWGAKDMQEILDITKRSVLDMSGLTRVEMLNEMMAKSIERLSAKFNTDLIKVCEEEKSMVSNVLIPNILGSFEDLKSICMKTILNLGALVYIDETFKEHTSYPANWFMDDNMLDNLEINYEMILSFLMDIPAIESKVIDPLDFVRVQITTG